MEPGVYVISADYELTETGIERISNLLDSGLSSFMPAGTKLFVTSAPEGEGDVAYGVNGTTWLWLENWPWLTFLLEPYVPKKNAEAQPPQL